MNLETRLRGRPRNIWQNEVREYWRLVNGNGRKEMVYNGGEWKKLLRTARNRHILHMPMEWMNVSRYTSDIRMKICWPSNNAGEMTHGMCLDQIMATVVTNLSVCLRHPDIAVSGIIYCLWIINVQFNTVYGLNCVIVIWWTGFVCKFRYCISNYGKNCFWYMYRSL